MNPIVGLLEASVVRFGADVAKEILPLGAELLALARHEHALSEAADDEPRRQVLAGNVEAARAIVLERWARVQGALEADVGSQLLTVALGVLGANKNLLTGGDA